MPAHETPAPEIPPPCAAPGGKQQPETPGVAGRAGSPVEPKPKKLKGTVDSALMDMVLEDVRDYQDEARMETPILNLFSGRYSAIRHPGVLMRRYKRHCQFFGVNTQWHLWAMAVVCLILSVMIWVVAFMYESGQVQTRSMGANPVATAFLAAGAILVLSALCCALIRLQMMWSASYAPVWIFENADEVEDWRTTGVVQTYLPRLAFIDASGGDFFSGPTRSSGPRQGLVHLMLPVGREATTLRHIRECYSLGRSSSTFTEVPARETFDLLERTIQAGELARGIGKGKLGKLLNEQWPWIVTTLALLLMFFASGAGQS